MKLLEENIGENFRNLGLGKEFINVTPNHDLYKKKIDKLDCIKTENYCSVKDTIKKMKREATDERKYLQIIYPTTDLYPQYIKNSQYSTVRKQTIQFFFHFIFLKVFGCIGSLLLCVGFL